MSLCVGSMRHRVPTMGTSTKILGAVVVLLDLLLGLLLCFWPGVWHELFHADVVRTTFYTAQAVGLFCLSRAALTVAWGSDKDLRSLYVVSIPPVVYLSWFCSGSGVMTVAFYLSLAVLWSLFALLSKPSTAESSTADAD